VNFWTDYRELPPALVRYLVAISITGPVTVLLWLFVAPESDRPDRWLTLSIVTLLACLAERFPIHLTHKTYVNVASAVYVAMLLTLPLGVCGVAALVAATGAAIWRRHTNADLGVAEALFNIGQTALYVTAAAVCVSVVDQLNVDSLHIGDIPLARVIVASLALHLFNSLLVATASARHLGIRATRVWRENLLIDIGPHGGMTVVGLSAAQLGLTSPLLILTLAIPAVLIHRAAIGSVQLRQNVRHALESLMEVVELRDPYTAGHSRRVAQIARGIALELGLTAEEADRIEAAGNVHDLGKVAIDPAILQKPGKLTESEWAEMKRHPGYGASALNRFESYNEGVDLIRGHHEAWDGSGYPDGLRGEAIPLGARILAVADAYDAMTSDRPYRKGMDHEKAVSILREGAGSQWDADIVTAFLRLDLNQLQTEPVVLLTPNQDAEMTQILPTEEPAVA
jgi:HD-GYP domain-containing protein (c-di-GMP phosphodiesterase class II)